MQVLNVNLFATASLFMSVACTSSSFSEQSSKVSSDNVETSYSNNNGVVETYTKHTTLEQQPDGSCILKTVEVRNGETTTKSEPIDCRAASTGHDQEDMAEEKLEELEKFDEDLLKNIQDTQKMMFNHF